MANRKGRTPGPQQHAEGQHGDKTHARFVEQLTESQPAPVDETDRAAEAKGRPIEGHHRLHEDRQQHDEADKNSEKMRAIKQAGRGDDDATLLDNARIPHEGDAS